jgi:hypothetical protein
VTLGPAGCDSLTRVESVSRPPGPVKLSRKSHSCMLLRSSGRTGIDLANQVTSARGGRYRGDSNSTGGWSIGAPREVDIPRN